jgi:hypothetical protein
VPLPLGFHSQPSPYPGIKSTHIGGIVGDAGRILSRGFEALGDLMTSLPGLR